MNTIIFIWNWLVTINSFFDPIYSVATFGISIATFFLSRRINKKVNLSVESERLD